MNIQFKGMFTIKIFRFYSIVNSFFTLKSSIHNEEELSSIVIKTAANHRANIQKFFPIWFAFSIIVEIAPASSAPYVFGSRPTKVLGLKRCELP